MNVIATKIAASALIALGILLIIACTKTPQSTSSSQPLTQPTTKAIQVISDPPGARIEVNQDYVEDARLSIKVPMKDDNFTTATTIRVAPTQQGQYVQSKYFMYGDTVPRGSSLLCVWVRHNETRSPHDQVDL
jgi:hypothetical protein